MPQILIIDDEKIMRQFFRRLLENEGYDVIEAKNGNEGIEQYQKNKVSLVVTDLIMPEKEGIETIKELKKLFPEVKIIAISGGGLTDPDIYLKIAGKLGAIETFNKPIDKEKFLSRIKELLII